MPSRSVALVAFSLAAALVASALAAPPEAPAVAAPRPATRTGRVLAPAAAHPSAARAYLAGAPVACLGLRADGGAMALGLADGVVRVIETATGAETLAIGGAAAPLALGFGDAGALVVLRPDRAAAYAPAGGSPVRERPLPAGAWRVGAVVPGGAWVAAGSDSAVAVVSLADEVPAATFPRPARVLAMAGGAGGEALVFGGRDRVVSGLALPPAAPPKPLLRRDGWVLALAASPAGVLVGGDERALARLRPGRPPETWRGPRGWTEALADSPDGRFTAAAGADHVVTVYRRDTRRPVARLRGHRGEVRGLVFAPAGDQLISAGADGLVMVWDVAAAVRPGGAGARR